MFTPISRYTCIVEIHIYWQGWTQQGCWEIYFTDKELFSPNEVSWLQYNSPHQGNRKSADPTAGLTIYSSGRELFFFTVMLWIAWELKIHINVLQLYLLKGVDLQVFRARKVTLISPATLNIYQSQSVILMCMSCADYTESRSERWIQSQNVPFSI